LGLAGDLKEKMIGQFHGQRFHRSHCSTILTVSQYDLKTRHQFETRWHARPLAATSRGFTFYVADPLSSIHEFTPIG
jgi:hypothetical protein